MKLFAVGGVVALIFGGAWFVRVMLDAGLSRRSGRAVPAELTFRQMHHGYIGAALAIAAEARGWLFGWTWWWAAALAAGLWLLYDDAYEHDIQEATLSAYRSPLRRWLLGPLLRVPGVGALLAWLNRILGQREAA